MTKKRVLLPIVALSAVLAIAPSASACPNCKEAIANQSPAEAARLKNGYFYSILLMIGMPFTLAGTGVFLVARAAKQGQLPEL